MSAIQGSMARPVCVLGFGRSGTSLTMRLLNLLGVEIGPEEELLEPGEGDNTRGYWEPRWMVELNDEILARLGTVWWRPLPAEPGWERSSDFDELRERACALLRERFGAAPLWGWKDPRTTLTLPFWKELVPEARYVICLRNPADAISSIQRRPDPVLSIGEWGDLWLEYTALAFRETHGHPRTLVFYEDYFKDAPKQITAMAALMDLRLAEQNGLQRRLLEEIERDLRHHATSSRELAATRGIPSSARALFLALRTAQDARHANGGHGGQTPEAIERVAPELWWERRVSIDLRSAFAAAQQTATALQDQQRQLTEAVAQAREETAELRTLMEREREHAHDQSLLAGMSVSRVWWFSCILSLVIAITDAILPHVVLIALLAVGPFFGALTGRWARTAVTGVWAVVLAVALGLPDGIWGTSTQLDDLTVVTVVALLSTFAATLAERHRYSADTVNFQSPL